MGSWLSVHDNREEPSSHEALVSQPQTPWDRATALPLLYYLSASLLHPHFLSQTEPFWIHICWTNDFLNLRTNCLGSLESQAQCFVCVTLP